MLEMPAMIETDRAEIELTEGYIISTKMVMCWKHRLEKGGWFRRARLVARQFRNSIDLEQTLAPTSMMTLPKMLTHYVLNVRREFVVVTLDIKDAVLMAAQPATENAYVQIDDRVYKLLRCLPGQRTAAPQWFNLFASARRDFGMEQDLMQPTLMLIPNLLYLTVHVDDVFMIGREDKVRELIQYFMEGDKFFYLKRSDVIESSTAVLRRTLTSTPSSIERRPWMPTSPRRMTQRSWKGVTSQSTGALLGIGRLMYMAGERQSMP